MPKIELTYQKAMAEIEGIIAEIEDDNLDIDSLSTKINRVADLIALCKAKLHATEEEVKVILEKLNDN